MKVLLVLRYNGAMDSKDAKYSCTRCFHPLHERDAVECFGVLYHLKCAPKNVRGTKKVKP